ncbi:MAG: ATP-dependent sacrificial sulfur transferase LarE [Chitinispirillaceae bacterium]|jgi:uncharacterized protein|nr:ATP-dependent sacrificial sulfur transferase LarE [Chitinispirillaceae bacterium]
MHDKLECLKKVIGKHASAVIAFSGGVDSAFLSAVAGEVLEKRVLLVTASSSTYPAAELAAATELAAALGLPHRVIVSEETDIPGFAANTPDRCYFCKRGLFSLISEIARKERFSAVFEGSNADDLKDFRPGRKAVAELGIVSPLLEAGLTKDDIRRYSAQIGLSTASKPSAACLASRFPYGETITLAGLARVGEAEQAVRGLGFVQLRVRSHGDLARVEVAPAEMDRAWTMRTEINAACRKAGFVFVAIDASGYRTGAMNEGLSESNGGYRA